MPIQRQNLGSFGVFLLHITKEREDRDRCESKQANRYVKRMQTDQRVVGGTEQIGLEGQAFVVDQVPPLRRRAPEEDRAQDDCEKPPEAESALAPVSQPPDGKVNRQAARQQTNRIENGDVQNIFGLRAGDALPDVENVGDHEDREDRAFGRDQAIHSHGAAIGKTPPGLASVHGYGRCAHSGHPHS